VVSFILHKNVPNDSDLQMLMGMELVSLKGFTEFMVDYEKLAYISGHVGDDTIK
jgi:hypothetical protein